MVGGSGEHVGLLWPVLEALAPEGGGLVHAGPVGAGHFTKMVHNGIEYGIMQAYGEGYELLSASELGIDVPAAVEAWRHGTVIRSWLLDLLARALEEDPGLTKLRGWADDSGEGRWTVEEAVRLAVPAPVISSALFARFASREDDSPTMKVIAALRQQFGGHAVHPE
jgi:6-phosphogluconate dehydrogenase